MPFAADAGFQLHLLLSVTVFAAMFAAYAYLAVWLQQVAGLGPRGIALALAGFGAAGILGNTAAAFVADRAPLRATWAATAALTLAVLGLSLTTHAGWHGLLLAVWGTAQTANVVLCQVRVTLAGRASPAFAMALNIAAANLGIALGALAGGSVVTRWGIDAIGWGPLGLLLPVTALALAIALRQPTSIAR